MWHPPLQHGEMQELQVDGIDFERIFWRSNLPERPMLAETTRFKPIGFRCLKEGIDWSGISTLENPELFHTQEDLKETTDISSTEPEIAFAFKNERKNYLESLGQFQDSGTVVLSKAIAFKDGRHSRTLTVEKGESFQIL